MAIEESILEAFRSLPPDKQQELLDHTNRLNADTQSAKALQSLKGLWSDLGISLSREDLDEARSEIWKNLRRDDS